MRVLHVAPVTKDGAIAIFVGRQIQSLNENGVVSDVQLVGGRDLVLRPFKLIRTIREIRSRLLFWKPDLVHAHYGSVLGVMCALAVRRKRPWILTVRGSDVNPVQGGPKINDHARLWLSRWAARQASAVVAVSDNLLERLQPRSPIQAVIVDGVDSEVFVPQSLTHARTALAWPEEWKVALFYEGERPQQKGRNLADGVLNILQGRDQAWRIVVLDGYEAPTRVAEYMAAADCLLVTSFWEGSPNIVRESLAVGCPVVSVDVGDVREWAIRCPGLFVATRDPEALADAVEGAVAHFIRTPCTDGELFMQSSAETLVGVYTRILKSRRDFQPRSN